MTIRTAFQNLCRLFAVAALLALSVPAWAVAPAPTQYQADVVSRGSGETTSYRFYSGDRMFRMDTQEAQVITRLDRRLVWIVQPGEKMYMEQPFRPEKANPLVAQQDEGVSVNRQKVGAEVVNGVATEKWKVTVQSAKGGTQTFLQWIDPKTGIAMRTADPAGKWSQELKNLQVGPQPAGLFEVPKGYQKMAVPGM